MDRRVIDVAGRRVHFRVTGKGPPLLLIHQSPRSSAEYMTLMAEWSPHFTCIAPDSPGFGHSSPLEMENPAIGDFAEALVDLLDRLEIQGCAAYGFHSGASILAEAALRHPGRFTALALGGYPVWTEAERERFGQAYLPPFRPSAYGEHLVWAWNRLLEQSWFFPWYDVRQESRMSVAHSDPDRIHAMLCDLLDSGDSYRSGYSAVFRSRPAIPAENAAGPPVLLTAYDGDPLQAHLDRLGPLPLNWMAQKVASREAHHGASLDFLKRHSGPEAGPMPSADDEGFLRIRSEYFNGLIHWRGDRGAERIWLHSPEQSLETLPSDAVFALDLPGHGLSDAPGDGVDLDQFAAIIASAIEGLSTQYRPVIVGSGLSALLAACVAARLKDARFEAYQANLPLTDHSAQWLDQAPDLSPDRFGRHLVAGWAKTRAETFFWPWFKAAAAQAIPFDPAQAEASRLAIRHREKLRARSGAWLIRALLGADRDLVIAQAPCTGWSVSKWAADRKDIWKPHIEVKET